MAEIGVVLLVIVLLAVRGRLMKLAFRHGGTAASAGSGEDAPAERRRSAR